MKRTILIYQDFLDKDLIRRIETEADALGFAVRNCDRRAEGAREEAYRIAPEAEIMYAISPKLLEAGSEKLKWFASTYAGVEPFIRHPEYFPSDSVVLTNANVYGPAIAEHVVMTLLMMMRRMSEYAEAVNAGKWLRNLEIDGIIGNTFIVAGTGDLGANIAFRLKGMGAGRVIGVNRSGQFRERKGLFEKAENPFDEIRPIADFPDLLPQAKAVILAVPSLPETDRLINAETLGRMRNDAYLVNVGRGNAVDEEALVRALNGGTLRGAALDVMETEPLPQDSPLRTAKNILITPHISGNTGLRYTRERNCELFLENLRRYAKDEPLLGLVDRKKGY